MAGRSTYELQLVVSIISVNILRESDLKPCNPERLNGASAYQRSPNLTLEVSSDYF
jgi:hypothetical protein